MAVQLIYIYLPVSTTKEGPRKSNVNDTLLDRREMHLPRPW